MIQELEATWVCKLVMQSELDPTQAAPCNLAVLVPEKCAASLPVRFETPLAEVPPICAGSDHFPLK